MSAPAVVAIALVAAAVVAAGGIFLYFWLSSSYFAAEPLVGPSRSVIPSETRTLEKPSSTPGAEEEPVAFEPPVGKSAATPESGRAAGEQDPGADELGEAHNAPAPEFDRFYPLEFGDQGYLVEALQRLLAWRGVDTYVDGDFANATERSVRQFQAQEGLSVTGVVDDTTWEALLPTLEIGAAGDQVAALQQLLFDRGYSIVIDGDYGPQTEDVVRVFQEDRGLPVDGWVGPITWAALLA